MSIAAREQPGNDRSRIEKGNCPEPGSIESCHDAGTGTLHRGSSLLIKFPVI